MKKMRLLLKLTLLLAIFAISFNSCKEKEKEKTLVSIEVTTQPTKKTYTVGEPFDLSGMVVTAKFSDGSSETITITSGMVTFNSATTGTNVSATITYTYEGKTVTATVTGITVNAAAVTLTSIEVTTQPTKKTYNVGDTFDPAGMVVTATYSDNSKTPVANTALTITADFGSAGAKTVTITYEGKTTTVTGITVNAVIPVITITNPVATTNVTAGSITGTLSVTATVTEGATLSYQWHSATNTSHAGAASLGSAGGAQTNTFTIPTGLAAGTYYYFCEVSATGGAESKRSSVATVTVAAAGGGECSDPNFEGCGTLEKPFEIGTAEQLAQLASLINASATTSAYNNKYYKLTADINLNKIEWTPIGNYYNPSKVILTEIIM